MVTGAEAALIKPIVDGLLGLFRDSKKTKLKKDAEQALSEVIRELLNASPDLRSAETKIAIAKAAGIINADLVLAEDMVSKHKASVVKPVAKKAAAKPAAKKAVVKPVAKKAAAKPAAKKAVVKPAAKKAAAKPAAKRMTAKRP